jgi:hypothetical protein
LRPDVHIEIFGTVGHDDGDTLRFSGAERLQKIGHPVGVFVHLPEGKLPVFVNQKCPVAVLAGFFFAEFGPGHVFRNFLRFHQAAEIRPERPAPDFILEKCQ